ncbi:MAG: IS66 family transposase [Candidatus Competibacteraceae bacterium]|nr:IS66 family transposase [Candidatus Competibacteraceae bacterium]
MPPPVIELSDAELDGLIERLEQAIAHDLALSAADLQCLLQIVLSFAHWHERLSERDITLHKLRKLAGIVQSSETLSHLLPKPPSARSKKPPKTATSKSEPPSEPVIHERCTHMIEGLQKGQLCPECQRGKLYRYAPVTLLRFTGQSPLVCTQHLLERFRCNACGSYFTAELSPDAQADGEAGQTYGYSARAMMALHKYYAGLPFYRQHTLQQLFGTPISASTVFEQCEHLANAVQPVFNALLGQAAAAVHYHLDDTTNRILNQGPIQKPDRKTGQLKTRTGIYTSGVMATLASGDEILLFQTNIGHGGEWIDQILKDRPPDAPIPILMCDALSRNFPSQIEFEKSLCNSHARREFVDVFEHFPDDVAWVLEHYALIWQHETHCEEKKLTPTQRLAYHQAHSLPVMQGLREWGQQQLDRGAVEANSGLGKAIGYFERHYPGLTAFCRLEAAQIDNNRLEQALKLVIRNRKNALFFKTLAGAAIADVLLSVIATAAQAKVNVFEYLIVLQRHAKDVKQNPQQWLPWTYQHTLQALDIAA